MASLSSCLVEEKVNPEGGEGKKKRYIQKQQPKISKYEGHVNTDSRVEEETSPG